MNAHQIKINEYLCEYVNELKFKAYEYKRDNLIARSLRVENLIMEVEKTISNFIFESNMHACPQQVAPISKLETLPELTISYRNAH